MRWITSWLRREREDDELAEELRSHLAIEARQRVEAGEDPAEAARAARRLFGSPALIQETTRETWGWSKLEQFADDLRFGLRMLRKTPAWTAVICATLALGIGWSTAIFSVAYGVLLAPLPYPRPSQLMALWPSAPKYGYPRFNVSAALWMHWKRRSRLFEGIALTRPIANFNLTGDGPPERLEGARTTADLPQVLSVQPLLGRVFTEDERRRDAHVAILSYRLWQRRFGGDAAIVGRKIPLNGEPFEVIGIMPPEYRYPSAQFELWTPLYIPPDEFVDGANYQYIAVGRLKPGVGVARARGEMAAIMRQLATDMPKLYRAGSETLSVLVEPLAESDAFQVRNTLYVLLAAVGCLLAIGCMNLGALLIARTSARSHEMALRAALGASAGRLRRQMLAEVLPLALAGSAGGILLADWILKLLLPYLPPTTPRLESIGLHGTAAAFAVAASLAVVLFAGLLPAGFGSRLGDTLRQNSRSVAGGGGLRSMLVVTQIAVAVVLVFAGALFARSLQALLRVNPGYSTRGVLTMHLAVTRARYPQDRQVADYYDRLLARIRTVPGVMAAGIVNRLPLSGIAQTGPVEFENKPGIFDSDWRSATPGYFEAIGIPLKRGRVFQETDRENSPAIGLIDEHLARRVFGVEDPVGKRFRISLGQFRGPWTEIVGVVGHIRNDSPEQDARPQVYWPETQRTQDRGALAVRTMGRPDSFAPQVIEQIRKEDAEQPVYDVRSMEEWLARTEASRNLLTALVGVFGGASLVLACLGLYGVVSYTALLRLREFGIRMALGAGAGHVRALVLGQAGRLALAGSALGLALAWPVSRAIQSLLFGVAPSDVLAWALAPLLLIAVALLAGIGPARRASKADPAVTLRAE